MDPFTPTSILSQIQVTHKHDGMITAADKNDLNFMHWNIDRMTNKLHLVELCIASFLGILHIIVISETWLTSENFSTYQIAGYYSFHNFRQWNEGGGVSIYIHQSLCKITPQIITDIVTAEIHHFLVIKIPTINTSVAVPYNRPKGSTPLSSRS